MPTLRTDRKLKVLPHNIHSSFLGTLIAYNDNLLKNK